MAWAPYRVVPPEEYANDPTLLAMQARAVTIARGEPDPLPPDDEEAEGGMGGAIVMRPWGEADEDDGDESDGSEEEDEMPTDEPVKDSDLGLAAVWALKAELEACERAAALWRPAYDAARRNQSRALQIWMLADTAAEEMEAAAAAARAAAAAGPPPGTGGGGEGE